jgi:antitoxin component of RelBE/YafQ-DinJ toxin-antitoxin module
MASKDLNIIQRGAASDFCWTAGPGRLTAADLGSIGEQRTDNGGALNALPTPFARFFIFKEAFRRVLEERNDSKKQAGRAYEQIVSNCLDVFELLYNKEYYENHWNDRERKIIIKEWNYDTDLKTLKNQIPILGNAVESYFNDDLDEKKLFFVILVEKGKEYLLATSSPFTGFITPPDLDEKKVVDEDKDKCDSDKDKNSYDITEDLKRKSSGKYFHDILLFEKRSADFKNYMYNFLFGNGSAVNERFRELRNYIQSFKSDGEITDNWSSESLQPIRSSDGNNELIVNGIGIKNSKDIDAVNYFSDAVLRTPYKLASSKFKTLTYIGNKQPDRDYDYLLPLSSQALEVIDNPDFKASCKEMNGAIEVTVEIKGKPFKKIYREDEAVLRSGEGKIIDLSKSEINLDLALFPNVLSPVEAENNYFKVFVSTFDNNNRRTFTTKDLDLDFYKLESGVYQRIDVAEDKTFSYGVRTTERSQQGKSSECGTKYYEVFGTSFDVMLAKVVIDSNKYTFALFPLWDKCETSDKAFSYAVDFGTSNTYISRREKDTMDEPQQLTMSEPIVSFLHDKAVSRQKSQITCWEDKTPEPFKRALKTEFVPPFFDGTVYKFPIRTALCRTGDTPKVSLFDNSNIAFFYEKDKPSGNQKVDTDIKWSGDEQKLRTFIRELLLIIKADMLQDGGSISRTGLIWFRPLSLKPSDKEKFEKIWSEESKTVLNLESPKQIKCYTESEAPYYYFNVKDEYKSVKSVAIVDIGGGSTDFVYFTDGEAKIANSVHFGCDVMWGNAYDQFVNSKKNGIFNLYKDIIHFDTNKNKALDDLNNQMVGNSTTQDIINFWISNDSETKISEKLKADFAYVFAYHFTAVIYYLASMLKVNGCEYPRTITFSGNGSRYIDQYLTSDVNLLSEITKLVMGKAFGEGITDIQLILPAVRKESTCYGGLYHKENVKEPSAVVYYGGGDSRTCVDVKTLREQFDATIKSKVVSEVKKMNGIYSEVISLLIRKEVVDGRLPVKKIIDCVNADVENTLDKFVTKINDKYSEYEQYNDTLFFIPVVNAIVELTKLKQA